MTTIENATEQVAQQLPNRRGNTRPMGFQTVATNVPRVVSRPVEAIVSYAHLLIASWRSWREPVRVPDGAHRHRRRLQAGPLESTA